MNIKTITWLTIFSIAMGYMESAIVIYLRKIYYPDGFQFPLVPLESSIAFVELFREAATIIMLLGMGILSAKTTALRFAHFIYCFAIWDLCYYLFLWLFLGWPESFFTWDILFLIPVPWVGPVMTPCIVSVTMIILAFSIIHFQNIGLNTRLKLKEWGLFIAGGIVVILSFTWDYFSYLHEIKTSEITITSSNPYNLINTLKDFVPVDFNWPLFITGESILLYGIMIFIDRLISDHMKTKSAAYTHWSSFE